MTGSASAQQTTASCHSQRARPVPATIERLPIHARNRVFSALPQPRHAASAAADVAAPHRALVSTVLSIEGARTYAHTTSMGALAVFLRFTRPARVRSARRWLVALTVLSPCRSFACPTFANTFIYCRLWRARLISCRRLAKRNKVAVAEPQGASLESQNRRRKIPSTGPFRFCDSCTNSYYLKVVDYVILIIADTPYLLHP
jgi:hypothetical protein